MPKWLEEIIRMLYHIPEGRTQMWKRIRIAMTPQELEEYKEWWGNPVFYHAIRGYPIVIEEHPLNPMYKMELGDENNKHGGSEPREAE